MATFEPEELSGDYDARMNTTITINVTTLYQIEDGQLIFFGTLIVRILALLSFLFNSFVLICLVWVKNSFLNYGFWFQLVVLASVDIFNGIVSFCFSFITKQVFVKNYHACGVLIFLFMYAQVNTLSTTCCICVSRFRAIRRMEQAEETRSVFHQEIPVIFASLISCLYCACPFLIWEVRNRDLNQCSSAFLFGVNETYLKLFVALGIFIPWIISNIMYGFCVFKLKRSFARIAPNTQQNVTELVTLTSVNNESLLSSASSGETNTSDKKITESDTSPNDNVAGPSTFPKKATLELPRIIKGHKQAFTRTGPNISGTNRGTAQRYISPSMANYNRYSARRKAQLKAIKLIGIITVLNTIAIVVPGSVLIRDIILSKDGVASFRGITAVGFVFVCVNSLVDAFIYGLYTHEIRSFIQTNFRHLRRFIAARFI